MNFYSPEEVLSHIASSMPADIILQALASVRVTNRSGSGYPTKLAISLKKPDQLRVEGIPLLGPPTFFLSVHDQTLKVYMTETGTFYIGKITADNLARYLPLRMDPEDVLAILTGTCPLMKGQNVAIAGYREEGHYRIDMKNMLKSLSLWVRMSDGVLERIDVFRGQDRVYQACFEEPLLIGETVIPQKINIFSEGQDGISLSIRYTDIQLLKTSDSTLFELNVPPGIIPTYLD